MKLSFSHLAFLCVVFLSTGCKTTFRISVQIPAVIDLPKEVKRISIVDQFSTNKPTTSSILDGVVSGEQVNGDRIAAQQFSGGMSQSLMKGNYESVVGNPKVSIQLGNQQQMDSIFQHDQSQAIVVLTNFDTDAPVGGVVLSDALGQQGYRLTSHAMIGVYCQNGFQLDQIPISNWVDLPSSGSLNPLALLQDVVNKRKWYNDLGRVTGFSAGAMFYPNWVWVDRIYYNKGCRELREAKRLIRFGNWDLAEKKLSPVLSDPLLKRKAKARASFNLALIYEGEGRLDDAIQMAEKSALEYNCKYAPIYLRQLKARAATQNTIELQQGH